MVRNHAEITESSKEKSANVKRRSFLKKASSVGAISGLGISVGTRTVSAANCGISGDEKSYSEIDYNKKDENSTAEEDTSGTIDYSMELQSSVIHSESEYIPTDNRWTHYFYEGAHLVSNEKESWNSSWSLSSNIQNHKVTIQNKYDGTSSLFVTGNSYDVGAVPSPEGSSDSGFGDAAYTVLTFAISSASAPFSIGTAAAEVAAELLNNNESDSDESIKDYSWTYTSSRPCEVAHYCHWLIRPYESYTNASVKVYEDSTTDMGSVRPQITWDIFVDPYGNTNIDDVTSSDVRTMTKSQQIELLESMETAVKIPYSEIDDPARKERADGGPIYKVVNPESKMSLK